MCHYHTQITCKTDAKKKGWGEKQKEKSFITKSFFNVKAVFREIEKGRISVGLKDGFLANGLHSSSVLDLLPLQGVHYITTTGNSEISI